MIICVKKGVYSTAEDKDPGNWLLFYLKKKNVLVTRMQVQGQSSRKVEKIEVEVEVEERTNI